jgi:hypothetical protein
VWKYHPKHVEQFPDINKLCNVASCWIYIGILLGAHPIRHISRINVKVHTLLVVCIVCNVKQSPLCFEILWQCLWVTTRAERGPCKAESCRSVNLFKKRVEQWSQRCCLQMPFLYTVHWYTIARVRLIGVFAARVAISADNVVCWVLIELTPVRYPEIIIQCTQLEVAMATDVGSLCWFGFAVLIALDCRACWRWCLGLSAPFGDQTVRNVWNLEGGLKYRYFGV